jgi:hypothetical protein
MKNKWILNRNNYFEAALRLDVFSKAIGNLRHFYEISSQGSQLFHKGLEGEPRAGLKNFGYRALRPKLELILQTKQNKSFEFSSFSVWQVFLTFSAGIRDRY